MSDTVTVMRDGRIIQTGAPREIYDRPRTRFVSEFLGTSNVFTGVVTGRDGPRTSVMTLADGAAQVRLPDAFPLHRRVTIAVRPERMWFAEDAASDANTLPVRISGHVFRGGYHAYEAMAVAGNQKIFVHRMAEDESRVREVGETCVVCWRINASVALEDDDEV